MRFSDRVDETSLSYIRGRYGRDSVEYLTALNNDKSVKLVKGSNSALSEPKRQAITNNKPAIGETPLQYARRMLKEKQEKLK